jgi:hypothetical protein
VQQNRDEMEVLFTFLAERYERKSVLITSNLVFSQWGRIFKDPMTTAAAIDRLVHHSVILELTGTSFRTEAAMGTAQEAIARAVDQVMTESCTEGSKATTTPTTTTPTTTTPTTTTPTTTTPTTTTRRGNSGGAAEIRG